MFTQGQKVRTIYGEVVTVMKQVDRIVYVYENCGDFYHVTKLFAMSGKAGR